MVDCVISSREIYEDYASDFPCFKAIFDVLGEVQHLGSAIFAWAEASLLWYKDMFVKGRQAVKYQALVQFVEVTQWEIGLKLFGLDGSFPGFRRATTHACLQSIGKRCVLAPALSRLSRTTYMSTLSHWYGVCVILASLKTSVPETKISVI